MATIGTGGDYATFHAFAAAASASDVGTAIEAADLGPSGSGDIEVVDNDITFTADSTREVVAPTQAEATSKARFSARIAPFNTGFILERLGMVPASRALLCDAADNVIVRRCVAVADDIFQVLVFAGTTTGHVVDNVAIYGSDATSVQVADSADADFYQCSILHGTDFGLRNAGSGTVNAYACIIQGAGSNDFEGTIGGDFNVSEDSTAPGSASTKYARTETGWFEDETSSFDLAIAAGKQGWWAANKDAIDQTGWPADVATDIVGTSRAAPIDPGVWQTPAAPGGSILPLVACDIANMNDMGGFRG